MDTGAGILNFIIYAVAIAIVTAIEACKQKMRVCLIFLGLLACGVYLGMNGAAMVMALVVDSPTNQGIPMMHWVSMGLQESYVAPGWYSGDPIKTFAEVDYSVEAMERLSFERIKESVAIFAREQEYALRFFGRKIASIWNNPTFECFAVVVKRNLHGTLEYWMKDILYSGGIVSTALTIMLNVVQSVILGGSILYLIYSYKNKKLLQEILLISFLGGFIFHIFWEAKCQYTIIYFVLLIPYAAEGFRKCIREIAVWFEEGNRAASYKAKRVCAVCIAFIVIFVIGLWDNTVFSSTIKLKGGEADYIWLCREQDYWRDSNFTKEGER